MVSEICALFEPLSALCAWVPSVAAVDAEYVSLKVRVSGEQFEANTERCACRPRPLPEAAGSCSAPKKQK